MEGLYGDFYVSNLWFAYTENGNYRQRYCQPDGLLFDFYNRRITVVEIKLQHTVDAWWQLRMLYLPVLSKVFPPEQWEFTIIEVVKWYDAAMPFPERVKLIPDIQSLSCGEFGVHICRP